MCLIGIAHLPENLNKLRYYKTFELRPCITTDIGQMIEEELFQIPKHAGTIVWNLFHAIKLICSKVLPIIPISGNVQVGNGTLNAAQTGVPLYGDGRDIVVDHLLQPMILQEPQVNES